MEIGIIKSYLLLCCANGFTFCIMSLILNRHIMFGLPDGLLYLTFSEVIKRSSLFSPPTIFTAFLYEQCKPSTHFRSELYFCTIISDSLIQVPCSCSDCFTCLCANPNAVIKSVTIEYIYQYDATKYRTQPFQSQFF